MILTMTSTMGSQVSLVPEAPKPSPRFMLEKNKDMDSVIDMTLGANSQYKDYIKDAVNELSAESKVLEMQRLQQKIEEVMDRPKAEPEHEEKLDRKIENAMRLA